MLSQQHCTLAKMHVLERITISYGLYDDRQVKTKNFTLKLLLRNVFFRYYTDFLFKMHKECVFQNYKLSNLQYGQTQKENRVINDTATLKPWQSRGY